MSRRFSMTSNPIPAVRASESQDEAKPLLADAEEKCDVVVEAIGFGNWSLLLVILLGFLFMGDSIEATLLSFLYDCVGGAFDLNPFEASTVISIVFAGEIVGAAFAGPIADQYGRPRLCGNQPLYRVHPIILH
jgi:fucose permease